MRLIVISDTHIPQRIKELPDILVQEINKADGIIHAGDFTSYRFYENLKSISKELYAVKGNMDDNYISTNLTDKLIIEIEGKRIGIMHGYGPPYGLEDILKKIILIFLYLDIAIKVCGLKRERYTYLTQEHLQIIFLLKNKHMLY